MLRGCGITFLFLIIAGYSFSQKEANVWIFGNGIRIDFYNGLVDINAPYLNDEGISTICDENGSLIFASTPVFVYDSSMNKLNYFTTPGSEYLNGFGSSTQGALLLKKPDSQTEFYAFFTDYASNGGGGIVS